MSASVDVEAQLRVVLKSHDRIGFGRRGVLDAEEEIRRWADRLSADDRARLREIVLSWIQSENAERESLPLHYNLPEHVQALAIRLCASLPIPEGLDLLRQLRDAGAFQTDTEQPCRDGLRHSIAVLEAGQGAKSAPE